LEVDERALEEDSSDDDYDDIKEGSTELYRAPLWPDVKNRWCVRHMKANFRP
jgi:hypothetical protein